MPNTGHAPNETKYSPSRSGSYRPANRGRWTRHAQSRRSTPQPDSVSDGERANQDLARALAYEGMAQNNRDETLAGESTRFQRALMSSNRFRKSLLG